MKQNTKDLAIKIDAAIDESKIETVTSLLDECLNSLEDEDSKENVYLNFYISNCYSFFGAYENSDEQKKAKSITKAIFHLRKALNNPYFFDVSHNIQCKIVTNLALNLENTNRPIESIIILDYALKKIPRFANARGNKGIILRNYASSLFDEGHAILLSYQAKDELKLALSKGAYWDGGHQPKAIKQFNEAYKDLESRLEGFNRIDLNEDSTKKTRPQTVLFIVHGV